MDSNFINIFQPTFWIKAITLVTIGFYVVFAYVVFTQVKKMSQVLQISNISSVLKAISVIHIILAISLFLFAVVIL